MKLKVKLEFHDSERQIITDFCQQIGMNIPEFCKRAVYYAINDSYKRAEVMRNDSGNDTTTAVSGGSSEGERGVSDAPASSLPDSSVSTDQSTTGSGAVQ